jgi:ribulose-phosphate 3-epimerase
MKHYKKGLYPSLFAAPQLYIKNAMDAIDSHAQGWHIDIMDLPTVHNIALNFNLIKELQKQTDKPLFIHLMVNLPLLTLPLLTLKKGDIITLHAHRIDLGLLIPAIKKADCGVFLALNPEEPASLIEPYGHDIDGVLIMGVQPGFSGQKPALDIVERVKEVKLLLAELGFSLQLAVDGAINEDNAQALYQAGAHMLCAGSALFHNGDFSHNAQRLVP